MLEILTNAQMREADRTAIAGGVSSFALMQNAGWAVADAIAQRLHASSATVLCGPGNNGGDGYIIAQRLLDMGCDVCVVAAQEPASEDARRASAAYTGARQSAFRPAVLVVDALYGTGLARPVEGKGAELIRAANESRAFIVAVDIPSGVSGDTGEAPGTAIHADLTVALCRKKLGHVLMPGKLLCGEVLTVPIGIEDAIIRKVGSTVWENDPALWRDAFPFARMEQHKYLRGHALINGGGMAHTGAARLAAYAALRAGAGLASIACGRDALPVYAATNLAVMCKLADSTEDYAALLADQRITAVALGPGNGVNEATKQRALAALRTHKQVVLDADALSVFTDNPQELFTHIASSCVLTPHEGEFTRLFAQAGVNMQANKLARAKEAAALAKAVFLHSIAQIFEVPWRQGWIDLFLRPAGKAPPCIA